MGKFPRDPILKSIREYQFGGISFAMGDVVSLKQFRKKRDRKNKDRTAQNNRARFGIPKNEQQISKDQKSKKETELDRKKLTKRLEDEGPEDPAY